MTPTLLKQRHIWQEQWTQPRYNLTLQPSTSAVMADRYTRGSIGYLTDLGVLWVAAGPNNDSFYYMFYIDGDLQEKILRVIGAGSSTSVKTGTPSPMHLDPPMKVENHLQIIAFNNDTVSHSAEVYCGGFTLRRRPDGPL